MDTLAISKDRTRQLVIELKRGQASDIVVDQIQSYLGAVQEVLLEPSQSAEGATIAQDDDKTIRRTLSVAQIIRFMRCRA